MNKEDNDWKIEFNENLDFNEQVLVYINGEKYYMNENFAGLTHAVLLLVDAINDKKVK